MKYLISGIIGFFLTLALSLPFQNVLKTKEAKAFAVAMKNKIDDKTHGVIDKTLGVIDKNLDKTLGAIDKNIDKTLGVVDKNLDRTLRANDKNIEMDIRVQPIVRIEARKDEPRIKFFPQYPAEAAARRIEGYVTLTFRVSKEGTVQNLKITESKPPQIFDEAALAAVSKWSFANSSNKGLPEQQKLRLNFNLGRTVAVEQRLTESGF